MRCGLTALAGIALALAAAGVVRGAFPQTGPPKQAQVPQEQRVDINHASLEELLKVPGMTKTWAGRIVRFRPYRSKNELLDKGIVRGEVYSRIKDYIVAHREKAGTMD